MHDGGTKLEIVVRLDTLLRDRLCDTLAVTTFELTCQQVAKPIMKNVSGVASRLLRYKRTISRAGAQYHA